MNYYLYSVRMNAWISKNGTGTSDRQQARIFTRPDAIDFCRLQRSADYAFGAVPIRVEDIDEVCK